MPTMMRIRIALSILILSLASLLSPTMAYAQSPIEDETETETDCNQWERIQSILLSEATRQPLDTKLELARVIVTKGACYLEPDFYTGYGVALSVLRFGGYESCSRNTHCRAYFMLSDIPLDIRESAALAAHIALTESPRIPRFHFDNWQSSATWWDSPRACPNGWFVTGDFKVC